MELVLRMMVPSRMFPSHLVLNCKRRDLVKEKANYWLVGAYWNNTYDMSDLFTLHGYWEMGWSDQQQPDFADLRNQMRPGDRIAIKARGGRGKTYIIIKAIGVVTALDPEKERVYVDWKLSGLQRHVAGRGEFSTIHEPLDPSTDDDAKRIRQIFTL